MQRKDYELSDHHSVVAISVILKCLFTHNQPHSQKGIYRMLTSGKVGDCLIYFLFCTNEDPVTQRGNDLLKVKQLVKAQDST